MAYKFKDNIFLVEGKVHGCIYDLNEKQMYALNKELKDALIELINNNHLVNEELTPVIQDLIEMNLIEEIEFPDMIHDIKEVADTRNYYDYVWIEVTKKCNLKCLHCYEDSSPHTEGEISWEDFTKAIQELKKNNVKTVQFIGGEPFMLSREKLVKMFEYASQHIEKVEVFTNATFIDETWIEVFKKYKIMVRISLHSLDKENQDKVTGVKGSFDKTYRGLQLLKEHNIPYSITCVAMKGIERHGVEKDPSFHLLDMVRMVGRGNLKLLDENMASNRFITPNRFKKPINVDLLKRSLYRHQCFGYKIYIGVDMEVYPCSMERRISHGNLREQSLEEILKNEIFHMTKDNIEECKDCEYRYNCFDCRSDALDREINAKPWYCTYLPLEGRWLDVDQYMADVLREA